ncbi:TorF family putative porin [Pseudoxanthomonas dokdonensis]|uniref:TIGR02001 family outer membrane protein n=1 Tax=Pseudoxanthomonas dokdonensis TaxID=344882 RepID=A0A0R0CQM6_9GAMM|nr:TorF family putative porin [Pseudoxanthomonas dokdonensis]KRG68174.1 hypothetical protein ABB29_14100 [Pseudoxanthomonas dokdonensis]
MKSVNRRAALVASLLLVLPFATLAQDAEAEAEAEASSPISWSLGATTDYVFRGLSQTDEGPAFQAGATYTAPFGMYAGVWGSNVDFGPGDPNYELDTFIGYNTDFGDVVNFDIMANRYNYPDAGKSNYWEFIAKTSFWENYSVTVGYTDDVFNSDTDGWYYAVGASFPLPADISLDLSAGKSEFEDGEVGRDYMDWSVALGKSFGPLTVTAAYIGTDGDGRDAYGDIADDRFVLSASVGM